MSRLQLVSTTKGHTECSSPGASVVGFNPHLQNKQIDKYKEKGKKRSYKEKEDRCESGVYLITAIRILAWIPFVISARVTGVEPHCPGSRVNPLMPLRSFSRAFEKTCVYAAWSTDCHLVPCADFLDSLMGKKKICRHFEIRGMVHFPSAVLTQPQRGFKHTRRTCTAVIKCNVKGQRERGWCEPGLCSQDLMSLPGSCICMQDQLLDWQS